MPGISACAPDKEGRRDHGRGSRGSVARARHEGDGPGKWAIPISEGGGTGRWARAERERGACAERREGSWAAGHMGRGSERAVRASWC